MYRSGARWPPLSGSKTFLSPKGGPGSTNHSPLPHHHGSYLYGSAFCPYIQHKWNLMGLPFVHTFSINGILGLVAFCGRPPSLSVTLARLASVAPVRSIFFIYVNMNSLLCGWTMFVDPLMCCSPWVAWGFTLVGSSPPSLPVCLAKVDASWFSSCLTSSFTQPTLHYLFCAPGPPSGELLGGTVLGTTAS